MTPHALVHAPLGESVHNGRGAQVNFGKNSIYCSLAGKTLVNHVAA
jgi:hypothetical protein